jgi:hypothetical protein
MAARLAQVEKLNQEQAAKLQKQAVEIAQLRRSKSSADGESLQQLRAERDAFEREVQEMTQFLADYGLTWVGDGPDEDEDLGETGRCDDAGDTACPGADRSRSGSVAEKLGRPPVPDGLQLDIQVLESQVQSLNAMVEKESARIERSRVGGAVRARLVTDDEKILPLTFFRDGLKLGTHAFMAYELGPAQQLIRDILDGYFPLALKDDHPDGVAMKVLDRTAHAFANWLQTQASCDPHLIDSGSRLAPAGVHPLAAGRRLGTGGDSLARLPEKVVRDGRICAVGGRGSASSQGASAPVGDRQASEEVSLLFDDRDLSDPTVRLQVKMEGEERVVLHMEPSQVIGDLEDALVSWRAGRGIAISEEHGRRWQLRTAFPRKVYSDRAQTLEEAGLTPSASLFVGMVEASET